MSVTTQREFDKRAKIVTKKLLDNNFKPFLWDAASEGDLTFYKIINQRVVVVLFSNDDDYVSKTITIYIVELYGKAPGLTIEEFVYKILGNGLKCISTNSIGLLDALIQYNFNLVVVDSWYI